MERQFQCNIEVEANLAPEFDLQPQYKKMKSHQKELTKLSVGSPITIFTQCLQLASNDLRLLQKSLGRSWLRFSST